MGQHLQGEIPEKGEPLFAVEGKGRGRAQSALAVAALLLATALAATGCTGSITPDGQRPTAPAPPEWNPQVAAGPPVASTSHVELSPQEVRDLTGEFMAVNLWAQTAHDTAALRPGDFHRVLFTDPSRECVEQHRRLAEETPDPPAERLIACGERSLEGNHPEWGSISPDEREARARRALGFLFWSTDPPSLVSVMIAQQRWLDVSVKTNPEFARFAARYDICEEESERLGAELAGVEEAGRMAEVWMRAERQLKVCASKVTAALFKRKGP